MLSPQALFKMLVSRRLPVLNADSQNNDAAARGYSYGELAVMSYIRKSHLLADEGSYFVANNAQAGIAFPVATGWVTTTPAITVFNGAAPGGPSVFLDYLALATTAAGSSTGGLTVLPIAVYLDTGNRYSSGGTQLTAVNSPNSNFLNTSPLVTVFAGAVTASAANSQKAIVGYRTIRPTASATVIDVVGETKILNFGGVEGGMFATYSTLTVVNSSVQSLPPIVIAPQTTALIYYWVPSYVAGGAPSYAPELGFWVR